MTTDYASFFERRADLCEGEPVLKGTRVTVRTVLASLAEGAAIPEIITQLEGPIGIRTTYLKGAF
jgi:uncharacterized protein (DUF433 family)